jgi:two-component system response regulator AtoC
MHSVHSLAGSLSDKSEIVPLKKLCKEAIRSSERNIILAALRANRWNRRKAAQELKISYRLLIYKIRAAGLISRDQRNSGAQGMDTTNGAVPSTD